MVIHIIVRACGGSLTRYPILWVAHASGMLVTCSPLLRVSDADMHHGTCVTHVPWCMLGLLTSGFLWSRWWGKYSRIPVACATRNFAYLESMRLGGKIIISLPNFKAIKQLQTLVLWLSNFTKSGCKTSNHLKNRGVGGHFPKRQSNFSASLAWIEIYKYD